MTEAVPPPLASTGGYAALAVCVVTTIVGGFFVEGIFVRSFVAGIGALTAFFVSRSVSRRMKNVDHRSFHALMQVVEFQLHQPC